MSTIDKAALTIGYTIMMAGGCFFLVAGLYLIAEYILQKAAFPGAWFKIACELHKQKKFKWQKGEEK